MQDFFSEYRITFLEETQENLERLNEDLIAFENDPRDVRIIDDIFRLIHTLKSSAAAVGMVPLSVFAHELENLIQQVKSNAIGITEEIITVLFSAFDQIQSCIKLAWDNREQEVDFQQLTRKIQTDYHFGDKPIKEKEDPGDLFIEYRLSDDEKKQILKEKGKPFWVHIRIAAMEPIKWLRAELILNHMVKIAKVIHVFPDRANFQSNHFSGAFSVILTSRLESSEIKRSITIDLIESIRIQRIRQIDSPIRVCREQTETEKPATRDAGHQAVKDSVEKKLNTENSIRVSIKKLDELLHLVGELVVTNSGYRLFEKRLDEVMTRESLIHDLSGLNDKLVKISQDMQRCVLNTRMLPIETLFNQYRRIVRDLSRQENKNIELMIQGGETEVDKKIIDGLHEAITHLIRNAVDHGVETREERLRNHKKSIAQIELSARQSGNHILITIKDDGRGIDLEKVKEKAIQSRFISDEIGRTIGDNELLNILFETGFSTSEKVSSISGRGVGLDVVRNTLNSMNGSVNIQTKAGQGTEFIIMLPLTLTITTVFVVESNGQKFGIPIGDIREAVKVSATEIEHFKCTNVLNLNDRIVPIAGLSNVFENDHRDYKAGKQGLVPIIILSYADKEVGLIVDQIIGKQEVVLKSLEKNYKSIRGLSGAAILGDGNIILVVDTMKTIQIFKEQKRIKDRQISEMIR
ncbi:MAG TPA: chemotaxis protein CheA [bacterium]|nr:chemotaxis protein CheA [bacterium]